jgi:hypothetical protein
MAGSDVAGRMIFHALQVTFRANERNRLESLR